MPDRNSLLGIIFCVAILTALTLPVNAKVAPVALEDLIKQSDLIFVGNVTSVRRVAYVDFAQVQILELIKGEHHSTVVYSAERTWPCDISTAVNGETALFFLKKYELQPSFNRNSKQTDLLHEAAAEFFDMDDMFRLSFDGRGRMPVMMSGNDRFLSISPTIIWPKGMNSSLPEVVEFANKIIADN